MSDSVLLPDTKPTKEFDVTRTGYSSGTKAAKERKTRRKQSSVCLHTYHTCVHTFVCTSWPRVCRKPTTVSGHLCPTLIREGVSSAALHDSLGPIVWKQQRFIIGKGIIRVLCLSGWRGGRQSGEEGDGNGAEGAVCRGRGLQYCKLGGWGVCTFGGVTQRIWVRCVRSPLRSSWTGTHATVCLCRSDIMTTSWYTGFPSIPPPPAPPRCPRPSRKQSHIWHDDRISIEV